MHKWVHIGATWRIQLNDPCHISLKICYRLVLIFYFTKHGNSCVYPVYYLSVCGAVNCG